MNDYSLMYVTCKSQCLGGVLANLRKYSNSVLFHLKWIPVKLSIDLYGRPKIMVMESYIDNIQSRISPFFCKQDLRYKKFTNHYLGIPYRSEEIKKSHKSKIMTVSSWAKKYSSAKDIKILFEDDIEGQNGVSE
jgi:hypothetical protein